MFQCNLCCMYPIMLVTPVPSQHKCGGEGYGLPTEFIFDGIHILTAHSCISISFLIMGEQIVVLSTKGSST
jgi:hypothetical protein